MGKVKIGTMTVLNLYVLKITALKYLKQNDGEAREILERKLRKPYGREGFHISSSVFD